MNFDWHYALCIQKLYHRQHFIVRGGWNKSLGLQPLERCYCENSGSPASACILRRHYSITYTQSVNAVNGLLTIGRVGNLLCERLSYNTNFIIILFPSFIEILTFYFSYLFLIFFNFPKNQRSCICGRQCRNFRSFTCDSPVSSFSFQPHSSLHSFLPLHNANL